MNTAQLLNTLLLPMSLALMMLALGLSLQPKHFASVLQHPKAVLLGLMLQLLLLPGVAWIMIAALNLPLELAAGLILIALAPGGATSNAITFLARGDTALSVCLTAVTSLIVPFTLPAMLSWQYQWLGLDSHSFHIPILATTIKLIAITLLPIALGMILRALASETVTRLQPYLQKAVGLVFVALVVAMAWVNHDQLPQIASVDTLAIFGLCGLAMSFALGAAKLLALNTAQQTTLTIEVGIQNAGTAMMVAATLMAQPPLAMLALYYGIAMNLPALLLIAYRRKAHSNPMIDNSVLG